MAGKGVGVGIGVSEGTRFRQVSQLDRKLPLVVSPVGLDPPGVAPPTHLSLQCEWMTRILVH